MEWTQTSRDRLCENGAERFHAAVAPRAQDGVGRALREAYRAPASELPGDLALLLTRLD